MKKRLLLSFFIIFGLFIATLACGINFSDSGNGSGDDTEALKLQLTLQALQMTQAA